MIDTASEHLQPLSAAAREVPSRAGTRGVNVSTVWRWSLRGVRGVRLETVLVGGIRMTSREALARFFAATTAAANHPQSISAGACGRRAREIEAAERALAKFGI